MTDTHARGAVQRVCVTGGRRGIGRAIAYAFAEKGAAIVINDVVDDEATGETMEGIAERGGKARFLKSDIGDLAAQEGLVRDAFAAFGGLDVLINNAGISVAQRGDMLDASPASFDRLIEVNLRGPYFLTQAVARRWLAESSTRPRSIINLASANAELASIDRAEYCISKTGVAMMTKLYAIRLAQAGIAVFELRPGVIRTDMTAVVKERYDRLIEGGLTPIKRWGEPSDLGPVAVALASGDFHFCTGQVMHVDGGLQIPRL